ncbi:MAG: RNA polymerase sigma factor [Anaerolineae bacterium]|nr:RNA polymerase sigma factor [Ardenticatenia bacterium]HQZ70441.1 RNA polymerase sigma factor [Anaerolineae bacterium]HRA20597.1 RNA polymerase sigma factor [Anaerolineae bacterium]
MRFDELLPGDDGDALLVRRMAGGDLVAHRALYDRHAADLLRYLAGRVDGGPALAEELLQEVMVVVWRQAAAFRGNSRVRTWLFGIAHHRAANLWRRQRLESRHQGPALDDEDHPFTVPADGRFGGTDLRIDLDRALLLLSWEQRAVLELTFYHGLAEQEVAQVLDIAPGTVKSRLYRAKTALRAQLEADDKVASHA